MNKGIMLAVFLFVCAGVSAEAQICGLVKGTVATPAITVGAGCSSGVAVARGNGPGLYVLTLRSGVTVTSFLVTAMGESSDFIATVRRNSNGTFSVRTYQMGRACPPTVAVETLCQAADITRHDADFSFEIR